MAEAQKRDNTDENELESSSASAAEGKIQPSTRNKKIRTLIVDDEAVSRDTLRGLLEKESDIEIVGISPNGKEAIEAINRLAPELVFLDVQMPEVDGFDVVSEITPARMPVIIFVTANENFALKAFDVHALDYLMKPCQPGRLQVALNRARKTIESNQGGELQQKLTALLDDLKTSPQQPGRLAVKSGGRIIFLAMADIDWIEAADNYVKLHIGTESHFLRDTMNALEDRLPANRFVRISRSTIVNIERIKELHPMFHGEYTVVLRNGARLTLSRGYRDKLRQIGLT